MAAPEITFGCLDGRQAARAADEIQAAATEVYADPPYRWTEYQAARFGERFAVQCKQPGFVLAQARHGEYLVGYAFGMPLRPATSWWRQLTTPLPADLIAEFPGRTFALADLAVRAPWRRQGIGASLYHLVMANRPEERATLTVLPAAAAAQGAFASWGWRKLARTRDEHPDSPLLDVLILPTAGGPRVLTFPLRARITAATARPHSRCREANGQEGPSMSLWRVRITMPADPQSQELLTAALARQRAWALPPPVEDPSDDEDSAGTGEVIIELPRDENFGELLNDLHKISPRVFVSNVTHPLRPPPTTNLARVGHGEPAGMSRLVTRVSPSQPS